MIDRWTSNRHPFRFAIETNKKRRTCRDEITEQNRAAIPTEIEGLVRRMVGTGGFEPPTSTVSR